MAQDNPCKGKAAFQLTINSNTVIFHSADTANSPLVHQWKFGDGHSSDAANPAHTYSGAGNYRVVHYIKNTLLNCIDSAVKEFSIATSVCDLVQPKFEWRKDSANALKLYFYNRSFTNSTSASASYKWNFGDGSSSTDVNPSHSYAKPGVYKVCLVVVVSNTCVREICQEVRIGDCNFDASFSWVMDNAHPMRGVKFTALPLSVSTLLLNIKWSFGDGTYSTEYSPLHIYQQAGTYKVCLRIEYFAGCVKEVCKEVTIPSTENCEALSRFTFERMSSSANALLFKAETNNAVVKYTWTFGDGTGALGATASHKYDRPGTYRVCLTIYRSDTCASTTCKEVVIGSLNCDQTTLKFETQRMNPPHNNAVKFTAVSNQSITSQSWTIWRHNSTTPVKITANDPTYIFQDTGYYKVCLRVTTANGCIKESCNYIHITYVPNVCHLQITPNPAITNIQFKVQVEVAKPVVASIIDMTGMRKAIFYLNATPGVNTFTLPVTTLAPGYYTLEVKVGDQVCASKFQKVN